MRAQENEEGIPRTYVTLYLEMLSLILMTLFNGMVA